MHSHRTFAILDKKILAFAFRWRQRRRRPQRQQHQTAMMLCFLCVLYTLWFIRLVFGAAAAVVVTTAVYTQPYTYWNIVASVCFFEFSIFFSLSVETLNSCICFVQHREKDMKKCTHFFVIILQLPRLLIHLLCLFSYVYFFSLSIDLFSSYFLSLSLFLSFECCVLWKLLSHSSHHCILTKFNLFSFCVCVLVLECLSVFNHTFFSASSHYSILLCRFVMHKHTCTHTPHLHSFTHSLTFKSHSILQQQYQQQSCDFFSRYNWIFSSRNKQWN